MFIFKAKFHQKAGMVPRDMVEDLICQVPCGVCPFAVNDGVPIYLDISLKRFAVVYTAGGIDNATVAISPEELEKYTKTEDVLMSAVDGVKITERIKK